MCTIFDEWIVRDVDRIAVQYFEEAARPAAGLDHSLCIFRDTCGQIPTIEHNGDVFSCDHYVDREHRIGNIQQTPLAEMLDSAEQRAFGDAKRDALPRDCRECDVLAMCHGHCPKYRFISASDGEPGLNYLCAGLKRFFRHSREPLARLVAKPPSTAKAPGIIVIHEIFGMTDWVQSVTDEFAAAGWIAIAPDLLTGMTPDGKPARNLAMSAAGGMVRGLPPDQVTADLNACVDYVKGLPSCNGKVAVVGFSWGGSQCFRLATNRKDLAAAFVFYGSGPDAADIPRIQAPVYGFYAGNDARIAASVPPTQEQMKAANKVFEPVTYEGAAHGFMRSGADPSGPEADKKAREAAWVRLKSLAGNYKWTVAFTPRRPPATRRRGARQRSAHRRATF